MAIRNSRTPASQASSWRKVQGCITCITRPEFRYSRKESLLIPVCAPVAVTVPLIEERYHLVVSRSAAPADRSSITWAEASRLPLCLLTADMQNRRIINPHLAEAGVSVTPTVESNSTIALMAHVATGRWASILPQTLTDLLGKGAGLTAVPIADQQGEKAAQHLVGLIAAWREPHTPVIAALLEEARRVSKV